MLDKVILPLLQQMCRCAHLLVAFQRVRCCSLLRLDELPPIKLVARHSQTNVLPMFDPVVVISPTTLPLALCVQADWR